MKQSNVNVLKSSREKLEEKKLVNKNRLFKLMNQEIDF